MRPISCVAAWGSKNPSPDLQGPQTPVTRERSCCSADSEQPRRCCHLANNIANTSTACCPWQIRLRIATACHFSQGDPGPHLLCGLLGPVSQQPKRHLDRFNRFSTAHSGDPTVIGPIKRRNFQFFHFCTVSKYLS